MLDVETSVVIDRPRPLVADYAADPDRAPLWYANIASVRWETPRPMQVGSRLAFVAKFLGRRLEYVYEVVALEPQRKLVMRTSDGPFPMETTYVWDDAESDATLMRLRNRGIPAGFSRVIMPFMRFAVRRANQKDLARLKSILERGPKLPT